MTRRLYAITLVALAACAPTRRRTPDDTLVVAIETPMTTDDPRYAISNYDAKLGRLVAAGLTTVATPTGEPRLDLAARVDRVDPLTVDITLRDGARFSDGSPVTAGDVARTYSSVLDPACSSNSHANIADRFTSIEARGDHLVRFHLKRPLATFLTDMEFGILSFHGVAPGECHPPVIGAGPYVLRELTSTAAYLDANPYYPTPPKLPHVEIRFVADQSARILMLVGGSVDVLQNSAQPDLVDDVLERPRVAIHNGPSLLLTYLMMNNTDPVLADVRVREAIALAIDRRSIVDAKLAGRARLATGLVPPISPAYDGNVPHWDFDPARSRALLDEAGLRPDATGVRLHLTYKTSADGFRVALARLIASELADVGIAVDVQPFEFATFFDDIKHGEFQLASMQTTPITNPDFYYFYFHSSRIPTLADLNAANRWRYKNAELDQLVERGRTELDPVQAKAIYDRVQTIVATDLPIIPLWHEDNVALTNVDVQGYEPTPDASLAGLVNATKSH
ncbi:MAG TPA: ABC transporter substrate-binding protein [Kofleriaceae bacterium]|jgi:peptide/nickel transport system substrate-binding protein